MNGDEYPSMADPASMMPQQQQPIPQGPTVQATPASTNSLADLANLLIPALAGIGSAKSSGNPALLGGLAGAGMGADAMQTQRANAMKYQQAQDEREYRQTTMQQAKENMERMKLADQDTKLKLSNREETLKSITDPAERSLFMTHPDIWAKMQIDKQSKPYELQFINTMGKDKIPPEAMKAIEGLSDADRRKLMGDLMDGLKKGGQWAPMKVDLPDGKSVMAFVDSTGKNPPRPIPMRDIEGGDGATEKEKSSLSDKDAIRLAGQFAAKWDKESMLHADPVRDGMEPQNMGRSWKREHPQEQWVNEQIDMVKRVADKQAEKKPEPDIEKTTLAKDAQIDFDDPKLQTYFQDLQKKYPKMTVAEMITKYKADHGIQQ